MKINDRESWVTLITADLDYAASINDSVTRGRDRFSASLPLSFALRNPLSPILSLRFDRVGIVRTDSTLVPTLLRCLQANIAEAICYASVQTGPSTFAFAW